MSRFALVVEYDCTTLLGWQRQDHGPTVQGELEQALTFVCDHPVEVHCSGRTDAGVHAIGQVAHFDTEAKRSPRALMLGANTRMPRTIGIRHCQAISDSFHARHSALARRYRYQLINRQARPGGLAHRDHAWERMPLDVEAMQIAANALLGEQDFSAFRSIQCGARHAFRRLDEIAIRRDGERVEFSVQANAFLHHMVRNLVGSLLVVGRGEEPPEWMAAVLASKDRTQAGATAAPQGLSFIGPRYDPSWGLPSEFYADSKLMAIGPIQKTRGHFPAQAEESD